MNHLFEDNLKRKANNNSYNNEEISKHSETSNYLFWTQIVYVDRNYSHIISNKYSLEDSANKKDIDVGYLKDSFDN